MIEISKSEKKIISKEIPNAHIMTTKHHSYCEETAKVVKLLDKLRCKSDERKKIRYGFNQKRRGNSSPVS